MRFQGILGLLLLEFIRILGLHCAEEKENEKSHVSVNFEVDMGPWWLSGKESACHVGDEGDIGLIHGLGRSPGGGHGNPLQYSCLENLMERRAWWAIVHGVAKSWT